ncbi:NUDIX domain-containing protein [Streptomyces sp. NPDC021749]|uniref:NUDIX domain-containing protein n=1 Tax=Streptomyces sp. NPDC021749 TaxID=3154905 RepID=UPI0033FA703E
MTEETSPLGPTPPHDRLPTNASALIHDGHGAYLLHLRDQIPGIWEPGSWSLLGGGREPGDRSLEETIRRELREEAGLDIPDLLPFAVEGARGSEGTTVRVQIFTGRWVGDPAELELTEGVMLHWFRPEIMPRLRMAPSTLALIRRHAALSAAAGHDASALGTTGAGSVGTTHRPPRPRAPSSSGAAGKAALHLIGVHLYLENAEGEVLLGLRHPDSACAGATWHFLAGHCERESAVARLVREAREEAGLLIEPGDVEYVHAVHLVDAPGTRPRLQLVFRARRWTGTPEVREPDRYLGWGWWRPEGLPEPIVPSTRTAIEGIRAGRLYGELGW